MSASLANVHGCTDLEGTGSREFVLNANANRFQEMHLYNVLTAITGNELTMTEFKIVGLIFSESEFYLIDSYSSINLCSVNLITLILSASVWCLHTSLPVSTVRGV